MTNDKADEMARKIATTIGILGFLIVFAMGLLGIVLSIAIRSLK